MEDNTNIIQPTTIQPTGIQQTDTVATMPVQPAPDVVMQPAPEPVQPAAVPTVTVTPEELGPPPTDIAKVDLSTYTIERMERELRGIQGGLEMLYTKNNSLEGPDISEGGGSSDDQAEYQRLFSAQQAIIGEINKRHMMAAIDQKQ